MLLICEFGRVTSSFTLHLLPGRYCLRATGAGGAAMEIDTQSLGNEPLVLRMSPEAQLHIDVQSNGQTIELAVLQGERTVSRRQLRDGAKFAMNILPGDYRLEWQDAQGKQHARDIRVDAAGYDLRLP
jgi:hypothetical protein